MNYYEQQIKNMKPTTTNLFRAKKAVDSLNKNIKWDYKETSIDDFLNSLTKSKTQKFFQKMEAKYYKVLRFAVKSLLITGLLYILITQLFNY